MKKGKEEPWKKLQVNDIWTPSLRFLLETGFERIVEKWLYFRIIISFYFITLFCQKRAEVVVCLAWTCIFVNLSYENSH